MNIDIIGMNIGMICKWLGFNRDNCAIYYHLIDGCRIKEIRYPPDNKDNEQKYEYSLSDFERRLN